MSTETKTKKFRKKSSLLIMSSYGSGKFLVEFYTAAFAALVFKYYETNLQLGPILTAMGIIIYSIWNALNDPLIGYLTIKPTPLSNKYGRRFPWIVLGLFIWVFCLVLIFAVPQKFIDDPQANKWLIFLWMVISTCLYDTMFSLWELNYQSMFPDKFRGEKVRSKAAAIATLIGVIGIAGGSILPTRIIDYDSAESFIQNAWIFVIIGVIVAIIMLPGVREDKDMIKRYLLEWRSLNDETIKQESFIKQLKKALKNKNFMAFILLYMFYQSATLSLTGSVHYVGDYVLPGESSDTTIIFAGLLVGALLSIPIWAKIARKFHSNQDALIYSALFMAFSLIPMTFMNTYVGFTITVFLFGMGFGGFWMLITPAMSDVIDEIVVNTGERKDGIYMGFRAFFGRLAWSIQAISFMIVHVLTGFDEKADIQSDMAIRGIHIHMAVIPMCFLLIGAFLFWKINKITPESMEEVHGKMVELGL